MSDDRLVFEGGISRSGEGYVIWIPKDLHDRARKLVGKTLVVTVEPIVLPRRRRS